MGNGIGAFTKKLKDLTFVPFVASLTLRTTLITVFPLILVTGTAYWECTLITSDKDITIGRKSNRITTNLTYLAIQVLQGLGLHNAQPSTIQPPQKEDGNQFSCL